MPVNVVSARRTRKRSAASSRRGNVPVVSKVTNFWWMVGPMPGRPLSAAGDVMSASSMASMVSLAWV